MMWSAVESRSANFLSDTVPDFSEDYSQKTNSDSNILIQSFDNNPSLNGKMKNNASSKTKGTNISARYHAAKSADNSATATSSTSAICKKSEVKVCQKLKQEQNESFQENQNFSRSFSVSSSASSNTKTKLKSARRGNSLDTVLDTTETPHQGDFTFEQKQVMSSSQTKTTTDGFSCEKAKIDNKELKELQTEELSYAEKHSSSIVNARLKADDFSAEKTNVINKDQVQLKCEETIHQQQRVATTTSQRVATEKFTTEKISTTAQEQRHTFSQSSLQQETNVSSKLKISNNKMTSILSGHDFHELGIGGLMSPSGGSPIITFPEEEVFLQRSQNPDLAITEGIQDDIQLLQSHTSSSEVDKTITRYCSRMENCINRLKTASTPQAVELLSLMADMIIKAWSLSSHGHELGQKLCDTIRNKGGLDILISNCATTDNDLQFASAKLLEHCLNDNNRAYVVERGLMNIVSIACSFSKANSVFHSRTGTAILENLFRHSEKTCSDVVRLGGLKSILYDCRHIDVRTLRHCAIALANLSLYGGPENQQAMIKEKVPVWLFPLAFSQDDIIKYFACLAITTLVANKEIESAVLRSGTLDLVEPFIASHDPEEFASRAPAHIHRQSKEWLLRLVPVLDSNREEARSLAAFHFAVEASIKKKLGNTEIFHDIGAIEVLKRVASSPNAIASKYAAQALQLIGEEIPHKLSQQVPLWSAEDVTQWVKQIGFSTYCQEFMNSRVDGDLLLQLNEDTLKNDIGISNGILRKRFLRELVQLKRLADYSSCDTISLNVILQELGSEYSQYTYIMLQAGLSRDVFPFLTEDQLEEVCGISNSIHRRRIWQALLGSTHSYTSCDGDISCNKTLDVFISYRRSTGSQLASLLKVHLQLRGFSVFIDVERLEAGKFDNNLVNSIHQAKHFILVLTSDALARCIRDTECKDWVHKEIVEALQSQCNIIPILDNFQWPEPESLPEDMRAVCYFNGVRWIHDYQDACVDKLERFMRGELNVRPDGPLGRHIGMGGPGTPGTPSTLSGRQVFQRSSSYDSAKGSSCSVEL
ncbi:NAD(+) hydrolase sarm1-like isoform X2 [Tachypleus tridentatus]|uniref:NAD(+) hydrolase sarm1-like isoform X2 n=1 Tax=Tachypleus tridentatus TaxID=6853 RepID=UPI003FCEF8B9